MSDAKPFAKNELVVPVILAGGAGSRLWPLSTPARPKPLLCLSGAESLLTQTIKRCRAIDEWAAPLLVCTLDQAKIMQEETEKTGSVSFLIEPEGRNSAPAILAAALKIQADQPDALMVVLPSDHWVDDQKAFNQTMQSAVRLAQSGALVAIGAVPAAPSPDYGYIRMAEAVASVQNAWRVKQFREKPDGETAAHWIAQGCFWNIGIFVWKVQALLEEAAIHCPQLLQACKEAWDEATSMSGQTMLAKGPWQHCPKMPIDVAIMEKTLRASMVQASFAWSDVGTFERWWDRAAKDGQGNATIGPVMMHQCSNNLVVCDRPLSLSDVHDHIIIETKEGVLRRARLRG